MVETDPFYIFSWAIQRYRSCSSVAGVTELCRAKRHLSNDEGEVEGVDEDEWVRVRVRVK